MDLLISLKLKPASKTIIFFDRKTSLETSLNVRLWSNETIKIYILINVILNNASLTGTVATYLQNQFV